VNALHAGGMEVLESGQTAFSQRLKAENHTLKRALTDPHIFSGIGTRIPTRSCTVQDSPRSR